MSEDTADPERQELGMSLGLGLAASAARLVPVPLLDDYLREKAFHLMVSRALKAHGRTYGSKKVAPLYGDSKGCMEGCLAWAVLLPFKLLLFPIRKVLSWVLAIKYFAMDMSEAVLLGRMLERSFAAGRLAMGQDDEVLHAEAIRLRQAFDNAVRGVDVRVLRAGLREGLKQVDGLRKAAFAALKRVRAGNDSAGTEGAGGDATRLELERILDTPKMRAFLTEFDQRVDENLAILEAR